MTTPTRDHGRITTPLLAAAGVVFVTWMFARVVPAGVIVWALALILAGAVAVIVRARLAPPPTPAADLDADRSRALLSRHFLFNTLHTIATLVQVEPALAQEALERVSALLRRVLAIGDDDVPLSTELSFVRAYVELERLRLGSRLSLVEDVDAAALRELVPPFTLQLLVENAITHGIEPKAQGGIVWIIARLDGAVLDLEVGDNGDGAGEADVSNGRGIGLRWLTARVRTGRRGTIAFETSPGTGFVARVRLGRPIRDTDASQPETDGRVS